MKKEILLERIKLIDDAINKENSIINQAMANLNMLNGGKEECLYWIEELDKSISCASSSES